MRSLIIPVLSSFIVFVAVSAHAQSTANIDHQLQEWSTDSISEIASVGADKRLVLLGESTHGTSEYYSIRAELSKELIKHHGFRIVVVEGDWTSSWKVNQYVKNLPNAPATAREALASFTRWPQWMWNNEEVLDLVEWMRAHNESLPDDQKAGFYGMDVYSFWESIDEVSRISNQLQAASSVIVEEALDCLLRFNRNHESYLRNVAQTGEHCGGAINRAITAANELQPPASFDRDRWFYVLQNLYVIQQGELHYRGMLYQGPSSWNERARHFKYTTRRLLDFYGEESKAVVWAHNTHIGDARATDMADFGMENIGHLARLGLGEEQVFSVGFGTDFGTVKAGRSWEARMEKMNIPAGAEGSLEAYFGSKSMSQFWLDLRTDEAKEYFSGRIPHRAIGVTYNPENEQNNYVESYLTRRYDAFIFIRETNALRPLTNR